jgi:hypothetical protein
MGTIVFQGKDWYGGSLSIGNVAARIQYNDGVQGGARGKRMEENVTVIRRDNLKWKFKNRERHWQKQRNRGTV